MCVGKYLHVNALENTYMMYVRMSLDVQVEVLRHLPQFGADRIVWVNGTGHIHPCMFLCIEMYAHIRRMRF